jgi:DNA polymerase-3 subunit delta'
LTAYPPLGGGWRVALIKPAETLKDEAANALLKTLEEPPARHLLVLTATVEDNLFPTIVSRCQKLAFAPLPTEVVTRELTRLRGLAPEAAALLAALSGGSLGRALALNPEELDRQRRQVLTDLERLPQATAGAVLDWAQRLAKNRGELEQFLLLAQMWYRDLLLAHFGSPERLLAQRDCREDLERERRRGNPETWFARFTALGAAQRHLQANLNMELTLDILGFRLQRQGSGYEIR